ncbi:hypothetical protein TWF569_000248 [Orbilia oligospora]|nr:hypothetical protein TWF751_002919 [Orbilia oligospora]KAF3157683.1 hypothetical protein TWF569_000248 [Orbilia oligospora]KAF3170966.1 hypothetical protein TWF225_010705 [Orbilia oligospora]KAF3240619.1 hypothetical protein TWF128_011234 [Orbilia oligospora]KAF3243681.1 hypothetical protein TWF217_011190 [Orbilia oligospora]
MSQTQVRRPKTPHGQARFAGKTLDEIPLRGETSVASFKPRITTVEDPTSGSESESSSGSQSESEGDIKDHRTLPNASDGLAVELQDLKRESKSLKAILQKERNSFDESLQRWQQRNFQVRIDGTLSNFWANLWYDRLLCLCLYSLFALLYLVLSRR